MNGYMRRAQGFLSVWPGLLLAAGILSARAGERLATYCNPLDLDYRFQLDEPCRREAADPAVVYFDHEYWLFASKSGGYWHSPDFKNWIFVDGRSLPIEAYAPAPAVIGGHLYYTAFETRSIFRADDPRAGRWTKVGDLPAYADPALFVDDDGRVYVYYGCSAGGGINGVELDPARGFVEIGKPTVCLKCDPPCRGWEVRGNNNEGERQGSTLSETPWIEGAWMTKRGGIYYLQYAAPGTEFHSYADGVFVGHAPLGPFGYAPYSPISRKSGGFATGAGHSGTFQDKTGRWWRVSTMVISVRHMFERRIGLFPAGFCDDGQMHCDTALGDYPKFLPETRSASSGNGLLNWMLLSYRRQADASSALPGHAVTNAFDENIQTWWTADTGAAGEWLKVDLGKRCRIDALQINFADDGAHAHGRLSGDAYQYYIEGSRDGVRWIKILDQSSNHRDAPHDYEPLAKPVKYRFVRLVNLHCPAGARFSVSDFRIFGNGLGRAPAVVTNVVARRDNGDGRKSVLTWSASDAADFYLVRYGIHPDRLFESYPVYDATSVNINDLTGGIPYFFAVDAINDSGITRGKSTVALKP